MNNKFSLSIKEIESIDITNKNIRIASNGDSPCRYVVGEPIEIRNAKHAKILESIKFESIN